MLWVVTDTGRPRKYENPDDLECAVNAYFNEYAEKYIEIYDRGKQVWKRVPVTIAGLLCYLDISRETWSNYLSGDVGKQDGTHTRYREICLRARRRVESEMVERSLTGEYAPQAASKILAVDFGYNDKNDEKPTEIKINISEKLDAECK